MVSELIRKTPKVLLTMPVSLAAFGANLGLLRRIGARFEEVSGGHEPFDFQGFGLTADGVRGQLPSYTEESRVLYRRFFLADVSLPFLGSVGQSLALAALLGADSSPLGRRLGRPLRSAVPLAAFVPALFDWAENVGFLYVIERYPKESGLVIHAAVVSHKLKLLSLFLTSGCVPVLIVANVLAWFKRRSLRETPANEKPAEKVTDSGKGSER